MQNGDWGLGIGDWGLGIGKLNKLLINKKMNIDFIDFDEPTLSFGAALKQNVRHKK